LLRLGFRLGARHRIGRFGAGGLPLQPGEFGLGGIACLESCVPFGTGSGRFRPSLHEFLEQVGPDAVKPGDFLLGRGNNRGCPGDAEPNSGH
jgi:hypothetical protein